MGYWDGEWVIGETEEGPVVCLAEGDDNPHVSIYADKAVSKEREQRDQRLMCEEIMKFLNGGTRPAWVADLDKFGECGLFSPCGSYVIATGPYIEDEDQPDGVGCDDSAPARTKRKELIKHIFG